MYDESVTVLSWHQLYEDLQCHMSEKSTSSMELSKPLHLVVSDMSRFSFRRNYLEDVLDPSSLFSLSTQDF